MSNNPKVTGSETFFRIGGGKKPAQQKEQKPKRVMTEGKKIFCVGRNKTGTTSIKKAFQDFGYSIGEQRQAERLTHFHYLEGNFEPFIEYCKTAQVFQDVPFSYPDTFRHMDKAFPGSKFILSVRDNADQWYQSLTRFHAKKFGKGGRIPTAEDLKAATYVIPGMMYDLVGVYGTSDENPYNEEVMKAQYEKHNQDVIEHFKDRPDDLLVINVAEKDAYIKFCKFIGQSPIYDTFPWENKT